MSDIPAYCRKEPRQHVQPSRTERGWGGRKNRKKGIKKGETGVSKNCISSCSRRTKNNVLVSSAIMRVQWTTRRAESLDLLSASVSASLDSASVMILEAGLWEGGFHLDLELCVLGIFRRRGFDRAVICDWTQCAWTAEAPARAAPRAPAASLPAASGAAVMTEKRGIAQMQGSGWMGA